MAGLIVHEWIGRTGGAERVLDSFSQMYPDAEILCLWNDAPGRYAPERIRESVLAYTPLRGRKVLAVPAMPFVWQHVRNRGYDWVLSSSHAFSHHISVGKEVSDDRQFSYVHTPARYIWNPELDARGRSPMARLVASPMRSIDRRRARQHRHIAANSVYVSERIRAAWGMESTVIHPPVEVAALQIVDDWSTQLDAHEQELLASLPPVFLLGASRFVPYKRLDLVIAAGEATGLPVVLAGSGPDAPLLVSRAKESSVPVRIVDAPSDRMLRALMAAAAVYVFPPVEDFGIMPVEAMALGTPVLIGAVGGATESVIDGVTGAITQGEGHSDLAEAVHRCLVVDPEACRRRAREFDSSLFAQRITEWMSHE